MLLRLASTIGAALLAIVLSADGAGATPAARGGWGRIPQLLPMPTLPRLRPADRVVVVSIDGLRPDAIGWTTPTLQRLAREGVTARTARTVDFSATLPSHASMLSGVDIAVHGVRWNAYRPRRGNIRFPSVLSAARDRGLSTSMFVGKRKLVHLVRGERDVDAFASKGVFCSRVNRAALPFLASARQGVHFVHYSDVDGAGHLWGWMSERYHRNANRADRCLAQLVRVLERRGDMARTLLVVTSDHGGHRRSHGTDRPEDVRIPWIAWGGPAVPGARVDRVHTRDTAATVYAALGLSAPSGITGRPVLEALAGAR